MSNDNTAHLPQGYHSVTPYVTFRDTAKAIAFYQKALGATEVMRLNYAGGVAHAEIQIGDSRIMMADENPAYGNVSAATLGKSPTSFMIYVAQADEAIAQAQEAGMELQKPAEDMFWGDRCGTLSDPFGMEWTLAQRMHEVNQDDMQQAMDDWMANMAKSG